MEGFIPMVYKSLKKNKTRRKYECLSTGAAHTYNIADFYTRRNDDGQDYFSIKQHVTTSSEENDKVSDISGPAHHRRYNSVRVDHVRSFGFGEDTAKREQLMRFRSQRMFSCVTGA